MSLLRKRKKEKKEGALSFRTVLRDNALMIKKVATLTPGYPVFLAISALVGALSNTASTYLSYLLFNAFDQPDVTFGTVAFYILLNLLVPTIIYLFDAWGWNVIAQIYDKTLHYKMHEELFRHAQEMDLACFDDPKFYNDYVWAMDESKARAMRIMDNLRDLVTGVITFVALMGLMASIDPLVALILLLGAAVNMIFERKTDKMYFQRNERTKPCYRRRSYVNRVYHLSDFAKELRIGRAGENLQGMYRDSTDTIIKEELSAGKKIYRTVLFWNALQYLAQYAPMGILLYRITTGQVMLGAFVASLGVIWQIQWSLYNVGEQLTKMPDNAQYVEKYLKFLNHKPKITSGPLTAQPLETLELKNVTFSYEALQEKKEEDAQKEQKSAPNSLEHVSFSVKKGEKVAIVGYNGAGKTTLTKLMMRLYDPGEGEILYNGHSLKEYDIPSLRERIGAVFQDFKLFAATVGENVLCREVKEGDRETVVEALDKATFRDRLETLPEGIDTPLTKEFRDDGVNLSGGEAQKVAIARIFARPFDLIIMDEPSSALDPSAEYALNHTILDYAKDKTVIFISHRLSTTRMADRILMFADGHLVEAGSHDELMKQNGKYAEMFRLQAEKYREGTIPA